jgi:hypothetical protein
MRNITAALATRGAATLLATAVALVGPAAAAEGNTSLSDDEFIAQLQSTADGELADANRLAKLLFSVASMLEGGQTSVRRLQNAVGARDRDAESIRAMLAVRFGKYADAVGRFKGSVSGLLDDAESRQLLFQSLTHGHQACWHLDIFTRLVETYGASSVDLMSTLSSIESCKRFRQAALQPPVTRVIDRALEEQDELRRDNRALREELDELEALIRDLIRIEQGE